MGELTKEDKAVVRRVLQQVKRTHWIQRSFRKTTNGKVCHCLVGHVNVACGVAYNRYSNDPFSPRYSRGQRRNRIIAALNYSLGRSTSTALETWNDNPSRTREDVIQLLESVL